MNTPTVFRANNASLNAAHIILCINERSALSRSLPVLRRDIPAIVEVFDCPSLWLCGGENIIKMLKRMEIKVKIKAYLSTELRILQWLWFSD